MDLVGSKIVSVIINEVFHELIVNFLLFMSIRAPDIDFMAFLGDLY